MYNERERFKRDIVKVTLTLSNKVTLGKQTKAV